MENFSSADFVGNDSLGMNDIEIIENLYFNFVLLIGERLH